MQRIVILTLENKSAQHCFFNIQAFEKAT